MYGASKAALHALADTYSVELAQFGIKVLCAIPGAFRTSAIHTMPGPDGLPKLAPVMLRTPKSVDAYETMKVETTTWWAALGGNEKGNPVRLAEVVVDAVRREGTAAGKEWSDWLFLGTDCINDVRTKLEKVKKAIDDWEDVGKSTDFN